MKELAGLIILATIIIFATAIYQFSGYSHEIMILLGQVVFIFWAVSWGVRGGFPRGIYQ